MNEGEIAGIVITNITDITIIIVSFFVFKKKIGSSAKELELSDESIKNIIIITLWIKKVTN